MGKVLALNAADPGLIPVPHITPQPAKVIWEYKARKKKKTTLSPAGCGPQTKEQKHCLQYLGCEGITGLENSVAQELKVDTTQITQIGNVLPKHHRSGLLLTFLRLNSIPTFLSFPLYALVQHFSTRVWGGGVGEIHINGKGPNNTRLGATGESKK